MSMTAVIVGNRIVGTQAVLTVAITYADVLPTKNVEYTFDAGAQLDPANVATYILDVAETYQALVDAAVALQPSVGTVLVTGDVVVTLTGVVPGYDMASLTLSLVYQGVTTVKTPTISDPDLLTLDAVTAQAQALANVVEFGPRLAVVQQLQDAGVDIIAWAEQQAEGD